MADIYSNLYMAISVEYYHEHNKSSKLLTDYIIEKLINENQLKINNVIDNLGPERFLLQHLKKQIKSDNIENERLIFNEIMNNPNIINEIKKNIHVEDNILYDLEKAGSEDIDKNSIEYESLKNKIINVDEFKNI